MWWFAYPIFLLLRFSFNTYLFISAAFLSVFFSLKFQFQFTFESKSTIKLKMQKKTYPKKCKRMWKVACNCPYAPSDSIWKLQTLALSFTYIQSCGNKKNSSSTLLKCERVIFMCLIVFIYTSSELKLYSMPLFSYSVRIDQTEIDVHNIQLTGQAIHT